MLSLFKENLFISGMATRFSIGSSPLKDGSLSLVKKMSHGQQADNGKLLGILNKVKVKWGGPGSCFIFLDQPAHLASMARFQALSLL